MLCREAALAEVARPLDLARARAATGASCDSCSLALFSCLGCAVGKAGGLSAPLCNGTRGADGLALEGRGVLARLAAGGGGVLMRK